MDDSEIFCLLAADKRNGHPDPLLPGAAFQTKSLDHAEAGFPGRTVKNHETHHPGRYQIPSLQYQTLNLIPNVMGYQKAHEAGCDECVFHRGDIVTECSSCNISILKDGVFITHPTDHYILPGISRMHLIEQCKNWEFPWTNVLLRLKR